MLRLESGIKIKDLKMAITWDFNIFGARILIIFIQSKCKTNLPH